MFEFPGHRAVCRAAISCALLLSLGGCAPDAHHHHDEPVTEAEEPEPCVVTVFTEQLELFMEYPRLVPGLEARFLAHLTVLETGEPIRSGQLRLELSSSTGDSITLEAAQPKRDGLFIPVGTFNAPGSYQATIVVESEQARERIALPPVVVHPDLASAFAAAEAEAEPEPANAVPFLLEQAWPIGLLLRQVERRALTQRLQVAGEVEAPRDRMAVVSAALGGRLLPPEGAALVSLGERVEKGQLLGYLEPPLSTSDAAALVALETERDALEMSLLVREFDLQAQALEIKQSEHQAKARVQFSRQNLTRIEGLRAMDLGSIVELEAARRDVEISVRELEGARALAESLAQAGGQLNTLQARSASARTAKGSAHKSRHALTAPIAGEVVETLYVEGEYVESQDTLYRVLDLERVWIAAYVSEFDLAQIGEAPDAILKFAAYPERSFDVLGAMAGRIIHFGRVVDPETRTITLRYEVSNPENLFHAGMFAEVFLETGHVVDAVALPEEAIVMDNGRPVAFVLLSGEMFQKRVLELGIRDGGYAEVLSGLSAGERVVTKGAYLVKLASASPASFGAGHAH